MTAQFRLPDLGENIKEAEVLKVLVAEGDAIAVDQPVLEVETDKAIFEVPCDVAGRVAAVHVREGDVIEIGRVLLDVEEAAAGAAPPPAPTVEPPAGEPQAPREAAAEPPAAVAPQPTGQAEEREPTPLRPAAAGPPEAAASAPRPAAPPAAGPAEPAFASPSVRQFAREIGVDIHSVSGSGPGGRISVEDVKQHSRRERPAEDASAAPAGPPTAPPLPDFSQFGETERERMGGVRRATAQGMGLSWATIPHVALFAKADVTALEAFRQRHRREAEAAAGNLTLAPIMLKIVVAALARFPRLNASADMETRETVYKRYYNLGVAVDTDRGLLVPVVRDADRKSIIQLSVDLVELAEKARAGKLTLEEMRGATFTVSNLGGLGVGFFSPIINYPEAGVLGLGRAEMEPVYIDGEFQPRLRLPLSLSIDHRLVDGADGARFLRWIVEACSDPLLLALEG